MRNRILYLTRNTIPYVKELQPLAGTVAGCILMQQLDYWFERYPSGFWKFLSPSGHSNYKKGDSWTEELGMSVDEFRTAFDKIGIRHKSKGQFDDAQDKFQGLFYCSYLDRRENKTYYFRNHCLVDRALDGLISNKDEVITVNGGTQFTVNGGTQFTVNGGTQFTGNGGSQSTQMGNPNLQEIGNHHFNTEITNTEITQKPQQPTIGCGSELVFSRKLEIEEKVEIEGLLKQVQHLPSDRQQALLDELAGALHNNSIKKGSVPFFRKLVEKELQGKFTPNIGVTILAQRNAVSRTKMVGKEGNDKLKVDQVACAKGARLLPSSLQAKLKKMQIDPPVAVR